MDEGRISCGKDLDEFQLNFAYIIVLSGNEHVSDNKSDGERSRRFGSNLTQQEGQRE